MELFRAKNVATYIVFPLCDADGDPVSAAGSLDSEMDAWADGSAPDGFTDCTNEATEIGTTGQYYLSLVQAEMNYDYIVIQIKSSTAKTQTILINTKIEAAISSRLATSGYTAPPTVTAIRQEMDSNSTKLANLDAAVSSRSTYAGGAVASVSAAVTVGTNNDKTGYALATAPPTAVAIRTEIDSNSTKLANLDATISSRLASASYSSPPSAASIRAEIDANSTKLDAAISTRLASASYTAPPTAVAIRTEMDSNSTKLANLDATISSRLPTASYSAPPSAASIADAVWDEAQSGHTGAGTFGRYVDSQLATIVGYIDTEVAAILAAVDTEVAAIKAKTDNLPASPAAVGSKMDIADAPSSTGANALADALLKRDMSAVTGEAARSPLNAFRFLRNKWILAGTTLSVKKEDDTTEAWSAVVSTTAATDVIIGCDPA